MSRLRGLVMVLIVAGIIGFVAVIRTSANATEEPTGVVQMSIGGGQSMVDIGSSVTRTPVPTATAATGVAAIPNAGGAQPTAAPAGEVTAVSAQSLQGPLVVSTPLIDSTAVKGWNPPALGVPLAYNPWDHYWFIRPVAAKYQNFELSSYPYGSNGAENDLRIHHGIDLPNPIGVEVLAAGDGTIISAQKGHINEFENITSYGNCIVIDHDFGYAGQHLYTLYAHLSAILVQRGDHVHAGQVIGLIGNTGQVTGPHVHFEVRVGRDSYFSVRNPVLWMAPYVGTGVVAGRVALGGNSPVDDATVTLIDPVSGNVLDRTDTYAGFGATGDDNWHENFVFPDVPAGRYLVTSTYNTSTWSGTVDVVPGATNWVDLQRQTLDILPLIPAATRTPTP